MKSPRDIVIRPVVSEKSYAGLEGNAYTFLVAPEANKTEIKEAIQQIWNVHVESVRTMNRKGKVTRTRLPSGNGSRVSTNIPESLMFRPIPAATPRSPSRKTGNALSSLPAGGRRSGSCCGTLGGSTRLDMLESLAEDVGATVGASRSAVKERTPGPGGIALRRRTS